MDKVIYVFAGPNGSGKSSVIDAFRTDGLCPEPYICPDNIARALKPDRPLLTEFELYVEAMDIAEASRKTLVSEGKSFTFETVFSSDEKLKFLRFAKACGFHIAVIYITTSDYTINLRRVKRRISEGGHDVPPDKIRSRYLRAMTLMPEVVAFSDEAEVYDNSVDDAPPRMVFQKNADGTMSILRDADRPEWIGRYLEEPLTEKGYVFSAL